MTISTVARVRLTPAERARTVLAVAASLEVGVLDLQHPVDRHAVDSDGSLLFSPPPESPERAAALASTMRLPTLTAIARDLAPVACADRVRGTVVVTGRVALVTEPPECHSADRLIAHLTGHPESATWDPRTQPILRLVPDSVRLQWTCETPGPAGRTGTSTDRRDHVGVAIEDYRGAVPDPLLGYESQWLPHLAAEHREVLIALAEAADPRLASVPLSPYAVTPLAVDRFGLVLRVRLPGDGHRDVRLCFPRNVRCGCDVPPAFNELLRRCLPEGTEIEPCGED